MKIKVGISNKHVHLNEEDFKYLFPDIDIEQEEKKYLSQPGMYASCLKVGIKSDKNEFTDVRIVGPIRDYTQVEISKTDAYKLGINPPIRNSGDLSGASNITIFNGDRSVTRASCIIACRHIHISEADQEKYKLPDVVKVKASSEKEAILANVYVKKSVLANIELHLDTDDANACLIKQGDEVDLII